MRLMRRAGCLGGFVAVGLAVLLCAACTRSGAAPNLSPVSSAPHSSTTAPSSPKPTPTASAYPADVPLTGHNVKPGERPPRYPATADARTQAGANAFAEFFMRTLDWAYATTNPSYMKHYYGPTCGLCDGIAKTISKTASIKHWYLGGRLTLQRATATSIAPVTAPADFCSIERLSESAFSTVDKTGKVYTGDGAHAGDRVKLCMIKRPDTWQITYMAGL
jgi:Family of unknown function (DUF6318)